MNSLPPFSSEELCQDERLSVINTGSVNYLTHENAPLRRNRNNAPFASSFAFQTNHMP